MRSFLRPTRGLGSQTAAPIRLWLFIVLHFVALGIALLLFALFHHVIPHERTSLNITVSRDAVVVQSEDALVVNVSQENVAEASGSAEALLQDAALSPDTAPTAVPTVAPIGDFSAKYADKFRPGAPSFDDHSYVSENLNITITEYYEHGIRFYIADFYIRDISCFRTGFSKDTYGRNITENILRVAEREQSVLSINGDFYGLREGGVCMRNGTLYLSDKVVREICVLYWDGSLECFSPEEFDCQREQDRRAYQIWNFGPAMLDENGEPRPDFEEIYHGIYGNQPRSALGYFEPGHYCFITADGRSKDSRGMTMDQLGLVAQKIGCKQCYNMDGGQTAAMAFGTSLVNVPAAGGRDCSDYLTIVDAVS